MAYDKVIDSAVLDSKLAAIANAIREKTSQTSLMTIDEMPTAIQSISTGGGSGGGGSLTGKGFRLVASSPSGGGYITGGLNINIETGTINNTSLTGVGFVI